MYRHPSKLSASPGAGIQDVESPEKDSDGIAVDFASIKPFATPRKASPSTFEKQFARKMFLKPSFKSPRKKRENTAAVNPQDPIIDLTQSDDQNESEKITSQPAKDSEPIPQASAQPPVPDADQSIDLDTWSNDAKSRANERQEAAKGPSPAHGSSAATTEAPETWPPQNPFAAWSSSAHQSL